VKRYFGIERASYHARKIRPAMGFCQQPDTGIEATVVDDGIFRIAGGEQDFQRWPESPGFVGELAAVHRPRHDHVRIAWLPYIQFMIENEQFSSAWRLAS